MTKAEYLKYHADFCNKMHFLTRSKNQDYTGVGDDPFANFTRVEMMGVTDAPRGFLVRILDKVSRLVSFTQNGTFAVKDESFEDTCLDLANYAILLAAYVKSKKDSGPVGGGGLKVVAAATVNNVREFIPPNLKGAK